MSGVEVAAAATEPLLGDANAGQTRLEISPARGVPESANVKVDMNEDGNEGVSETTASGKQNGSDLPTAYVNLELQVDQLVIENPLAVVFEGNTAKELGRSPLFREMIRLPLFFQRVQPLRIVLYDYMENEGQEPDLKRVGSISTTLGHLVALGSSFIAIDISEDGEEKSGTLKVKVYFESSPWVGHRLEVKLSASDLDRMDLGGVGRSDPFFCVIRTDTNDLLYRSEFILNTLSPQWRRTRFDIVVADPEDTFNIEEMELRFEVFDMDIKMSFDIIGSVTMKIGDMKAGHDVDIVRAPNRRKDGSAGILTFLDVKLEPIPSFGEYLVNGCELWMGMGIDFTKSNIAATEERSLHYLDSKNVYEQLIDAICPPLMQYDPDGEIDCFGFAMKPKPGAQTDFDFALTVDGEPCIGAEGLKSAYEIAVKTVELSGPTKVVPVLEKFVDLLERTKLTKSRQRYLVIVIIADGVPVEFDVFRKKLVELSSSPLSVFFVGVGTANFDRLKDLNRMTPIRTDYSVTGKRSSHAVFRFFQYNKCKDIVANEIHPDDLKVRQEGGLNTLEELLDEMLTTLPKQVVDFFVSAKMKPLQRL